MLINSPEWIAVFTNSLFAAVTVGVIIWQVCVMRWQGGNSDRNERIQNRLIRFQFEYARLQHLNDERSKILKLAFELCLALGTLHGGMLNSDKIWPKMENLSLELRHRLRTSDTAAFTGKHDAEWFINLNGLVDLVTDALFTQSLSVQGAIQALQQADKKFKSVETLLALESAIRQEFSDFTLKWDKEVRD